MVLATLGGWVVALIVGIALIILARAIQIEPIINKILYVIGIILVIVGIILLVLWLVGFVV